MRTEITRPQYLRKGLRYASDVTEAEWRLIEPQLPAPRRLGRPRKTELIAVVNALFYIARTGCQWRMLPGDFPHYSIASAKAWLLIASVQLLIRRVARA
jgi:transposase